MTKLAFPTMAEQAVAEFQNKTRTMSLAVIAKRRGAEVSREWDRTVYIFDDDTSIEVRGRGQNHSITTHLP